MIDRLFQSPVVWWLMFVAAIVGCGKPATAPATITSLRVSVLPGEGHDALEKQFSPLVDYLETSIGVPCRLIIPGSYEESQAAFEKGEVDLGWFGGYTFVNLNRSHNAIPLVSRDRDMRFTSYFLVRAVDAEKELGDFRGKRMAFGSRLSTSGHLMPRYFLRESGIMPEEFFGDIRYTGAHDATAFAVRDGQVDIGVASGPAVDSLFASGQLDAQDVVILKETPPYVDYVWACQSDLSTDLQTRIRDAFLNLSDASPEQAEILSRVRAGHFIPVHSDRFDALRSIIDSGAVVGESP